MLSPKLIRSAGVWVLAAGLLQVACSDVFESRYSSMADAKRDGAIDRGWLPSFLPDASRNIREIHDLDTSRTWCSFEFAPGEAAGLREALTTVEPIEASSKSVRAPGVGWWPELLQGKLQPDAIEKAGLKLHKNGSILFAIDWEKGRGFFYREGS